MRGRQHSRQRRAAADLQRRLLYWALTDNRADAHYDLGAGGHGVTTDCHDSTPLAAFDPTTGMVTGSGPHCFSGDGPEGVSAGIAYKF